MTVTLQLPAEMEAFVGAEVARGAAEDEADFFAKAVEMYRELQVQPLGKGIAIMVATMFAS